MKFVDYESSHITPQMTLLKKFNEVLKYLREIEPHNIRFYLHTISYFHLGTNVLYAISTSNIDLSQPISDGNKIPKVLFKVSPFDFYYGFGITGSQPNLYITIRNMSANESYTITKDVVEEI